MTYIREEESASTQWPLGENEKSKASPPGNAAEELVVVDTKLRWVLRGCRYASNRFLLTSRANCLCSNGKLSSVNGPPTKLCEREKDGHLERWWA